MINGTLSSCNLICHFNPWDMNGRLFHGRIVYLTTSKRAGFFSVFTYGHFDIMTYRDTIGQLWTLRLDAIDNRRFRNKCLRYSMIDAKRFLANKLFCSSVFFSAHLKKVLWSPFFPECQVWWEKIVCLSHPHVHMLNKVYLVIHFMDKNQKMYDLCLLGSRKLDLRDFVEL